MTAQRKLAARKKCQRPLKKKRYNVTDLQIAMALTRWSLVKDLASTVIVRSPGNSGRPDDYPPTVMIMFGILSWGFKGEASTERMLSERTSSATATSGS